MRMRYIVGTIPNSFRRSFLELILHLGSWQDQHPWVMSEGIACITISYPCLCHHLFLSGQNDRHYQTYQSLAYALLQPQI
jgi:hypothetical protein